jgi:hypothetical protein
MEYCDGQEKIAVYSAQFFPYRDMISDACIHRKINPMREQRGDQGKCVANRRDLNSNLG